MVNKPHTKFRALAFFALCLSLLSSVVCAQDIFVRPTTTPSQPTADMGMGRPKPVEPAQAQPVAPPVQHSAPPPTPAPLPTPQPTQPVQVYNPPTPSPPPTVSSDLQIIPINEDKSPIASGTGPNVIAVSIGQATIGEKDKANIYHMLGLNAQEIAQNCYFEEQVIYTSDTTEGGGIMTMGKLTTAQQHFSGTISEVVFYPTLACKKIKQPISGIIIDQGGFYKVGGDPVSCPSVKHDTSFSVSFRYLGDGKGECIYK